MIIDKLKMKPAVIIADTVIVLSIIFLCFNHELVDWYRSETTDISDKPSVIEIPVEINQEQKINTAVPDDSESEVHDSDDYSYPESMIEDEDDWTYTKRDELLFFMYDLMQKSPVISHSEVTCQPDWCVIEFILSRRGKPVRIQWADERATRIINWYMRENAHANFERLSTVKTPSGTKVKIQLKKWSNK